MCQESLRRWRVAVVRDLLRRNAWDARTAREVRRWAQISYRKIRDEVLHAPPSSPARAHEPIPQGRSLRLVGALAATCLALGETPSWLRAGPQRLWGSRGMVEMIPDMLLPPDGAPGPVWEAPSLQAAYYDALFPEGPRPSPKGGRMRMHPSYKPLCVGRGPWPFTDPLAGRRLSLEVICWRLGQRAKARAAHEAVLREEGRRLRT